MARKIGVLTFHRCINYGSYWQARCLIEGLRTRGHDAVLLDHDSHRVKLAEWESALQPVLPSVVPASDYSLYRRKIRKFVRALSSLPLSRRFSLEDSTEMEEFDVVLVGGDEVWNLSHPWYGGYPLFFGDGVRARRLVSYAASFGSYSASKGLEPWWADRLRRFQAIAVRDENSRRLIEASLGFAPELVLDPCLQFANGGNPRRRRGTESRRPFVALYGHNFSDWFSRHVRRWAKAGGCSLVSVGYRNDWADEQWLTAGPHDFVRFMARAEAVATNFFHGCVFALREKKPFVCELSPYRSNKIRDLVTLIGGEKHLVSKSTAPATYNSCLGEPLDPGVLERIDGLRASTDAYLSAALA